MVLGLKLDTSTWNSYKSGYNSWVRFTELHKLPLEPTVSSLSDYILFMSAHIKPDSVGTYLSGLVQILEPVFPNIRNIRNDRLVLDIMAGCRRMFGSSVIRKAPLSADEIARIVSNPDDSYDRILFHAMIAAGFHGLLRLGELCDSPNKWNINTHKRTSRLSVKWSKGYVSFLLPAHKADKYFEGNRVVLRNIWPNIDVVKIFSDYVKRRDARHPFTSPLWLTFDGEVPNRQFFMKFLKAEKLGDDIAGQSIRAGGATALASIGFPGHAIQALGRWSSEAWRTYLRQHPLLFANLKIAQSPHHRSR
ncbi:hypothetical protein CVT24_004652 [Panaeolus cyanescens]|uniref:Tyr recombinase domain-containing protein n=1 Tax=Panaeolus cyanescens TaxID=181874 RepID=A0A409YSP0_9AGAR|nr:hypothetical protein CVT24_004652 [Panaeolus cyanescens]